MTADTTALDRSRMQTGSRTRPGAAMGLAGWAMATAVVALVLAASSPVWVPMLRSAPEAKPDLTMTVAVRQATDTARSAQASARGAQATAEESVRATRELAERTAPLAARIDTLEATVRKLATASATAPTAADMHRLALAGAIAQLRPAIARPTPFSVELAVVQGLAQAQDQYMAALRLLAPHASVGIPTLRQLQARFAAAADAALMAEAGAEGVPLASEFLSWVASTAPFGSGRMVHDLMMPETAAALDLARDRLRADDLAGAVAAVSRLRGPAAAAMRPWTDSARARVVGTAAMDSLVRAALADLPGGAR
ncbi:hypothetical protein [Stella sp.]|uniref:hypothetical protein n=1 Tax=Stella sp. TaxID=2912054 RepID=UPI0035B077E1